MVIKKELMIASLLIIALFMLTGCQGPLGYATTYTAPVIEEIGCFDSAGKSNVYLIDSGVKRGGAILNGFAFTTSIGLRGRGGFRVTDIRDPQIPFKAHILVNETHYGTPGMVITKNLKAYVCGDPYSFKLSVIDITNPVNPVELGSGGEGCGKRGLDMQLVGNQVYILNTRGLYIIDVSNPSSPATIGKFEPELQKAEVSEYNPKEGEIIVGMTLNSFVVYGNYVYLGTSDA